MRQTKKAPDDPHVLDRIVTAAADELDEVGVRGFRLRRLAEIARISLGTLTHYFPSKESLLEAAAQRLISSAWRNWDEQKKQAPEQGLQSIVVGFFEICLRYRPLTRVVMQNTARDGRLWGASTVNVIEPLLADVETLYGRETRILAHSVATLAMAYAVYDDEQLMKVCRVSTVEEAQRRVRAHLCRLASLASPRPAR